MARLRNRSFRLGRATAGAVLGPVAFVILALPINPPPPTVPVGNPGGSTPPAVAAHCSPGTPANQILHAVRWADPAEPLLRIAPTPASRRRRYGPGTVPPPVATKSLLSARDDFWHVTPPLSSSLASDFGYVN